MDFAGYSALSGRKNWAQVRQDRLLESQFMRQMQSDLQARIEKEAQARAGVTEYMNQLNQASVLEQDLERVKGVEEEQRKAIVEGLKKAGNDYNKFLMGNGASLLNSYREGVMKSQEMQDAINNKLVFAQSSLDNYLGRKARPVPVTLPDGTTKEVSMDEQWKMFDNGEITKVNYAGSVVPTDPIKVYDYISKTYGKDKYTRQQANKEDIMNYAMSMGAEEWEAQQIADNYEGELKSGATPVYFKNDEQSVDYNQLIAAEKYRRLVSGEPEENQASYIDLFGDLFVSQDTEGRPSSPSFTTNPLEYKIDAMGQQRTATVYEAPNLGTELLNDMVALEGFVVDEESGALKIQGEGKKDVYFVPKAGKDAAIVKGQLAGEDIVYQPESFVRMKVGDGENAQTMTFIKAKAGIEHAKRSPGSDYTEDNVATIFGDLFKNNKYQGTVLIPVSYDAKKYAALNDKRQISAKMQSTKAASMDVDVYAKQQAQNAVLQNTPNTVFTTPVTGEYEGVAKQIQADPQGYAKQIQTTDIMGLVTNSAKTNGVSENELLTLLDIESNFNPLAVSSAGALGMGQLMPDTAKELGVTNPFDPAQNIQATAQYYSDLKKRYAGYKDPLLPVAAYNWGLGNVDKAVKKFGADWVEGANSGFFDDNGNWIKMPAETNSYMSNFAEGMGF